MDVLPPHLTYTCIIKSIKENGFHVTAPGLLISTMNECIQASAQKSKNYYKFSKKIILQPPSPPPAQQHAHTHTHILTTRGFLKK